MSHKQASHGDSRDDADEEELNKDGKLKRECLRGRS